MHYLKLYYLHIKYIIKGETQYRANFISGLIANFYTYFLMYISIYIITHEFKVINGWDYNDLVFLTALNLFSYAVAISILYGYMAGLESYINEGRFDRVLIRPINPIISMIFDGFAWTGLGQVVVSSIFLANSISNINIQWTSYRIFVLLSCIIGGILIQCAAQIFFGTLNFWMRKSGSLTDILYYNLRSFINYPISIYGGVVKNVLTYILPWAFINYYPALFILGKTDARTGFYLFTPIIGLALFIFSIWLTKLGISKYESVGN